MLRSCDLKRSRERNTIPDASWSVANFIHLFIYLSIDLLSIIIYYSFIYLFIHLFFLIGGGGTRQLTP